MDTNFIGFQGEKLISMQVISSCIIMYVHCILKEQGQKIAGYYCFASFPPHFVYSEDSGMEGTVDTNQSSGDEKISDNRQAAVQAEQLTKERDREEQTDSEDEDVVGGRDVVEEKEEPGVYNC